MHVFAPTIHCTAEGASFYLFLYTYVAHGPYIMSQLMDVFTYKVLCMVHRTSAMLENDTVPGTSYSILV
jgi:hypothetical protein